MKKKNKLGFTLIEMLVVVLIIGILAAIALPQYQNSVIKADFAEAYIKLKAAAQIEEMCRLQNGTEICEDQAYIEQVNTQVNGCQDEYCSDFDSNKQKFMIFNNQALSGSDILASAAYLKEDVCVCITTGYNFVLTQGECDDTPSKDYSKILGIPDGQDDYGCGCC